MNAILRATLGAGLGAGLVLSAGACEPPPEKPPKGAAAKAASEKGKAKDTGAAAEKSAAAADGPVDYANTPISEIPKIKAEPAGPLTDAEKALIAADPKELSGEDRRKRAYALRKKIMQNPESDSAQALLRAREAFLQGKIDPAELPTNSGAQDKQPPEEPGPGQK